MPLSQKESSDVERALEMTLDSLVMSINHLKWLQEVTNGPSIVPTDEPDEPIEQPLKKGVFGGERTRTVQS